MRWICLALSVVISTTNASWVLAEDKPKDFVEFREFNASDRPQVIAPPAAQEEAERLVRSLATACNSGDFMANAVAEGLNSKIMAIKRGTGGYRNVANFKAVIYFYCGGLRLYP